MSKEIEWPEQEEAVWMDLCREFSSEKYFRDTFHRSREIIAKFTHLVAPGDGPVLEIGANHGYNCFALSSLGYQVHAVDLPEIVDEPRIAFNYEQRSIPFKSYRVGSGQPTPTADTTYAGALVIEVLEHLQTNPLFLFRELVRVLLPGGRILLTTPNQARLRARIKVLLGRSLNDDCRRLLKSFEASTGYTDAGFHWKLYTLNEVCILASAVGLQVTNAHYQWEPVPPSNTFFEQAMRRIERMLGICVPSCRDWLVFEMQKTGDNSKTFRS